MLSLSSGRGQTPSVRLLYSSSPNSTCRRKTSPGCRFVLVHRFSVICRYLFLFLLFWENKKTLLASRQAGLRKFYFVRFPPARSLSALICSAAHVDRLRPNILPRLCPLRRVSAVIAAGVIGRLVVDMFKRVFTELIRGISRCANSVNWYLTIFQDFFFRGAYTNRSVKRRWRAKAGRRARERSSWMDCSSR